MNLSYAGIHQQGQYTGVPPNARAHQAATVVLALPMVGGQDVIYPVSWGCRRRGVRPSLSQPMEEVRCVGSVDGEHAGMAYTGWQLQLLGNRQRSMLFHAKAA
jgi:hypothetical protein